MQIATLNYQYDPKENPTGDSRAKLRHRQVLTSISYPQKRSKQRQSLHSDLSTHTTIPLPPIAKSGKRPNSIRIKGSGLRSSSNLAETSAYSFLRQIRSNSRQSNKSDQSGARSRSVSPAGTVRSTSKLVRLKFGYPIKFRSADFYGSDRNDDELHLREESFVNDSVRSAHQSRRASIIPHYEALDDPHLRQFFQSPIVLDIVRKTLKIDMGKSYKQGERPSKIKKRTKTSELDDSYHQIVTKGSSGYAKLNGYDCIPGYAPARHHRRRSNTVDPTLSSPQRWRGTEFRVHLPTTQDKSQPSANVSVQSFPAHSANALQQQQEEQKAKKSRKYQKSKQPKPIASSSPLRHPLRQLVEATTANIKSPPSAKTEDNVPEQNHQSAIASNKSQD